MLFIQFMIEHHSQPIQGEVAIASAHSNCHLYFWPNYQSYTLVHSSLGVHSTRVQFHAMSHSHDFSMLSFGQQAIYWPSLVESQLPSTRFVAGRGCTSPTARALRQETLADLWRFGGCWWFVVVGGGADAAGAVVAVGCWLVVMVNGRSEWQSFLPAFVS